MISKVVTVSESVVLEVNVIVIYSITFPLPNMLVLFFLSFFFFCKDNDGEYLHRSSSF